MPSSVKRSAYAFHCCVSFSSRWWRKAASISSRGYSVASVMARKLPRSRDRASGDRRNRLRWVRADVLRARTNEAVVGGLFEHMRAPADHATRRERRREQLAWDAAPIHHDARVELDV